MKCKHDQEYMVVEYGQAHTSHMRSKGGHVEHVSDFGNYTGVIEFFCNVCKFRKTYSKSKPKWLQERLDEVLSKD